MIILRLRFLQKSLSAYFLQKKSFSCPERATFFFSMRLKITFFRSCPRIPRWGDFLATPLSNLPTCLGTHFLVRGTLFAVPDKDDWFLSCIVVDLRRQRINTALLLHLFHDESTIFLMAGVDPPRGILFDLSRSSPPLDEEEAGTPPAPFTLTVEEELEEEGPPTLPPPPPSLTMFLQETSFSSRAPTFLSRSPTMLRADMRAEGARGCCPLDDPDLGMGDDLAEEGGVSGREELPPPPAAPPFSDFVSKSAASLLESAATPLTLLFASEPPLTFAAAAALLLVPLSLSGMSREVESRELRLGCLEMIRNQIKHKKHILQK